MKKYDPQHDRIVVYEQKASRAEYWDALWESRDLKRIVERGVKNYWLRSQTKKYLKPGATVLEGGCGRAQNVYGLQRWGYDAYGADFAFETIIRIKALFPDLKISDQDVRHMNFSDGFFDGYWSLGLIEHFWEGYDDFIKEAHRVLKPGGYFFLTFPWISPMRRSRIKRGKYEVCQGTCPYEESFYQFMFPDTSVREKVESFGFEFVRKEPYDALKGIKYEPSRYTSLFQRIYDMKGIVGRGIRFAISLFLKNRTGHMCLCVFRKKVRNVN